MPAPAVTPPVPWLDAAEQTAWRSFISGSRRLLDQLDADLKTQGVTNDDYGVLVALSESDEDRLRMTDLANISVESRSRLSHHIGRLEARGLVARETCPNDRRGTWAVLTAQGRSVIETVAPHHVAGVRDYFLDQITAGELATVGKVFARINDRLGAEGGDADEQCPDTAGPTAT